MGTRETSANSLHTHFVDIHEVLPEEEEEDEEERTSRREDKVNRGLNKQLNRSLRDARRPHHKSFSRQVSLETGFSVLNRESKAKDERSVLPRSGRSFGGFDSATRIGAEARNRGDFSIFKTKSTLSKQNSLLPTRKEKGIEAPKIDGAARLDDESVNRSVPAGRYFAALRGPELDQVKVTHYKFEII